MTAINSSFYTVEISIAMHLIFLVFFTKKCAYFDFTNYFVHTKVGFSYTQLLNIKNFKDFQICSLKGFLLCPYLFLFVYPQLF